MSNALEKKSLQQRLVKCISAFRLPRHEDLDCSRSELEKSETAVTPEKKIDLVFLNDYGGPLRGIFEIEAGRKPSELAAWMLAIAKFKTILAKAPEGTVYIVHDGIVPKHVNMAFDFIRESDTRPCTVIVDFAAGTAVIKFT